MVKVLALTLGDRFGVGPELVARLLDALPPLPDVRIVVIGDQAVFERGRQTMGLDGPYPTISNLEEETNHGWAFLHRPFDAEVAPVGRLSEAAGHEMLEHLGFLAEAVNAGTIGGIVYAPLNKQAMRMAGHEAGDELAFFLDHLRDVDQAGEINILGDLWTSRVTSHVPLRDVGDLITIDRVGRGIDLLADALMRSGNPAPRLAVAALNPHAGEGGAFGREEIDILAPAIEAAKARGIDAAGPFPSDTVFPRARDGNFDGVVTMFHDQGQIALKLMGLGQGITLLAGFPVPIATPGHGTAYDIAGTGKARIEGLLAATTLTAKMMTA